jgi:glutamate/tyrosine decarboxylase-like PLP-dependent enzyme
VTVPVQALGGEAPLAALGLPELLNVRNADALDLLARVWATAPAGDVRAALDRHTLSGMGYQDYGLRLQSVFDDPLPPAVVLVAATAHYSWEKIVRALGIGANQLRFVPVDQRFRMDPDALWAQLRTLHATRTPVLACVSVCGSTEESAVDRLDRVLEVRAQAERELGMTFHVHSDAAYGGYAAAVTRRADGSRRTAAEARAATGTDWPSDQLMRALTALGEADSVTIDPHKLGYVPYPAGAFLLKDRRARDLVAVDPPYLTPARGVDSADDLFLGKYILEGSKPGAAAAAVWLSHKVLPLDERGYGYLVERTVAGARRLHAALAGTDLRPFRVVVLPEPDLNIVCYVVHHPILKSLEAVNDLNERIYARMSLGGRAQPEYIITRTRFTTPIYDGAVEPVLKALGVASAAEWRAAGDEGIVVLRSTVMDPFLAEADGPDHVAGFVGALRRAASASLEAMVELRA